MSAKQNSGLGTLHLQRNLKRTYKSKHSTHSYSIKNILIAKYILRQKISIPLDRATF